MVSLCRKSLEKTKRGTFLPFQPSLALCFFDCFLSACCNFVKLCEKLCELCEKTKCSKGIRSRILENILNRVP